MVHNSQASLRLKRYKDHETRVEEAIEAVKENPNSKLSHIASAHGINRRTLSDRINGKRKPRREAHREEQVLTDAEEEVLKQRILEWDAFGMPPKHSHVLKMATEILEARVGPGNYEKLGDHWVTRFLERHNTELKTKIAHSMDKQRQAAMTKEKVEHCFAKLRDLIVRHRIQSDDIWNADEKGFEQGQGSKHKDLVVASASRKVAHVSQVGRGSWLTLMECVSAAGVKLPGFYISQGAAHYVDRVPDGLCEDDAIAYTHNGWTNDEIALKWLTEHFDVHARPSAPGRKRLLICDGHGSHETYEFQKHCIDHGIILFCFPSHTTHALQPLDVGVFSPFDRAVKDEQDEFLRSRPAFTRLTQTEFIRMCARAREKAITSKLIKSAFAKSGIHPLNKNRILTNPDIQWHEKAPRERDNRLRALPQPENASQLSQIFARRPNLNSESDLAAVEEWINSLVHESEILQARNALLESENRELRKAPRNEKRDRRVISRAKVASVRTLKVARKARLEKDSRPKKRQGSKKEKKGTDSGKKSQKTRVMADDLEDGIYSNGERDHMEEEEVVRETSASSGSKRRRSLEESEQDAPAVVKRARRRVVLEVVEGGENLEGLESSGGTGRQSRYVTRSSARQDRG